jgi:hypothetical protein
MQRLKPFDKGPVRAIVAGSREELWLFGYTAIREGIDRYYRRPNAEAQLIGEISMVFGSEMRAMLSMRRVDERERQEQLGSPMSPWRLCLSPSLATLLSFRLFLDDYDPERVETGCFETTGVEWVRFPSDVVIWDYGIREVEVSPAYIGLSFQELTA